jgi:hypothetical protein
MILFYAKHGLQIAHDQQMKSAEQELGMMPRFDPVQQHYNDKTN